MSGAHRSTTQSPLASAAKSIVWMLQTAGAVVLLVVPLAGLAFVVYKLVTQPRSAWAPPIVVACGITVCVFAIGHFVWYRIQRRRRSAEMG